jgi:dihydrofolate reductase
MPRPLTSVFLGLSLDGCIAGPGGDLSLLDAVATDPPEDTGFATLLRTVDALVMGRTSYETVAAFEPWPYEGKRTLVLTHRSLAPRVGVEMRSGALADILDALGAEGAAHVYLDGGDVVRQALAADLVDRLTLSWVPVVLGKGVRLFDGDLPTRRFKLEGTSQFPSGLAQARYVRG